MTDEQDIERAREELTLSEGVGGVPDIPEDERATVGDADDDNVDTGEPQVQSNR